MTSHITHTYNHPGYGFDDTIKKFHDSAGRDPFRTWLIVPTERLARRAEKELEGQNVPLIPSRICTLNDFCSCYFNDHRSTTRYITKAEAGIILLEVLAENRGQVPLIYTGSRVSSGTLDGLQDFFSVITRRKIDFPSCLGDLLSEKTHQIGILTNGYRKKMKDLDVVDDDLIVAWTLGHLNAQKNSRFGHVYVYGLFEPLPLEDELLTLIRERSERFHCSIPTGSDPSVFHPSMKWAGDPASRESSPASDRDKKISAFFRKSPDCFITEDIRTATFQGIYSEIAGIASEIAELHEKRVPYSDIYVAFPDMRENLELVKEVFSDFAIPLTAATRTPLLSSPVIRFLLSILALPAGQYSRENVISLVRNPYFRSYDDAGVRTGPSPEEIDLVSRFALIENSREEWITRLENLYNSLSSGGESDAGRSVSARTVHEVRKFITQLFDDIKIIEGKKTLDELLFNYNHFLKNRVIPCLKNPPDEKTRMEEDAALYEFYKILERLSKTAHLVPERRSSAGDLMRILSSMAEKTGTGTDYDPDGVTVLGIRECVHQSFPYLFIAGLNEGAMPRLTTRLPFTNTLENQRIGTRSLAAILREERYYFISALISGSHVYMSAPLSDDENPLLTSAFFERARDLLPSHEWGDKSAAFHSHSARDAAIHAGEMIVSGCICESLDYLPDSCTIDEIVQRINIERYFRRGRCDSPYDGILSLDKKIRPILGERFGPSYVWSPTGLETYAGCPMKFFIENVIGLEPLPDVEQNLSSADRGTVVHDILCIFYRRWRNSGNYKVLPSNLAEASVLMTEIVSEALLSRNFHSPLWEATCIRLKGSDESGPGLFEQFLSNEILEADSPLLPSLFEFSFGMKPTHNDDPLSLQGPVELESGESGTIRIRGKIDRIDLSSPGKFCITDYKTGSVIPTLKDIRAGKALQLPLYLAAYEKISGHTGVAAGYYKIRRPVENKILLCATDARELFSFSPASTPDFREIIAGSQFFAGEYIRRIRNGEFPLPHTDECPNSYCEYYTICRFNPFRIFHEPEVS
jgi:ATP-dependent helicase/DNAse subunit B